MSALPSQKYQTVVNSWIEPMQTEYDVGYGIDYIARRWNEKATGEYKNEKANAIVDMVGNCHDSVQATKGALNFSKSIETITDKLTSTAFEKHSGRETATKWKHNIWITVDGDTHT
ncbi:protein ultrapetala 1 [Tanacetum coccineum]